MLVHAVELFQDLYDMWTHDSIGGEHPEDCIVNIGRVGRVCWYFDGLLVLHSQCYTVSLGKGVIKWGVEEAHGIK